MSPEAVGQSLPLPEFMVPLIVRVIFFFIAAIGRKKYLIIPFIT